MKKRIQNAWKAVRNFFSKRWVRRAIVTTFLVGMGVAATWAWSVGLLAGWAAIVITTVSAWLVLPTAQGVGLFMVATMESFNIFSAMNSSPWTAENFGADKKKADSAKRYVIMSVICNEMLGIGASLLSLNAWPFLGTTVASAFIVVVYWRALQRGMRAGNVGWQNMPDEAKVSKPSTEDLATAGASA